MKHDRTIRKRPQLAQRVERAAVPERPFIGRGPRYLAKRGETMSPKLSLIITIAVGVVAFGAPAASGQDRLGEARQSSSAAIAVAGATAEHGIDRANAAQAELSNGRERIQQIGEGKLAHQPNVSTDIRGQAEGVRLARSDRGDPLAASLEFAARSAGTASVAPTSSGRGVEWPQLGAGFGLGILLALGVVLGLRHARVRPLPQ